MESHRRSIAKAVSYRIFASGLTCMIAWWLTEKLSVGLQIGLLDGVTKLVGYFLHERVWARIQWGKPKAPEYEI